MLTSKVITKITYVAMHRSVLTQSCSRKKMEHGQSVPAKYILLWASTLASGRGSRPQAGQAAALPAAV